VFPVTGHLWPIADLAFDSQGSGRTRFANDACKPGRTQFLVNGAPGFFPLTSVDSLVRTLIPGLLSQIESIAILSVWRVVLVAVAQRSMFRRLVR